MAFNPKAWQNAPNQTTPLSAAAMMDLETRVTNTGFGGLVSKTASYTAVAGDVVYSNPASGGATITLPAPAASTTVTVIAGSHTSTTNPTTVAGTNITGLGLSAASSYSIYVPGATAIFTSDGTNWYITSNPQTLHTYNVADFGFDANGNDVNSTPWANLLAAINADPVAKVRGAKIVFPTGDYCLNNCVIGPTTITGNGMVIIEGQGDGTRIFPGGSQGKALTINCQASNQLKPVLRNFRIGYDTSLTNPDLPYSQPIVTVRQGLAHIIENVTGYLKGTGVILYLDSTFDGWMHDCYFESGQYAIPILWDSATNQAFDYDTILWRNIQCHGEYGIVMNYGGTMETVQWDEYKYDAENYRGLITAYESSLASNVLAGATTITLQTGDGAHFAANDSIAIGEGMGTSGHTNSGNTPGAVGYGFEVNKVVSVAGDVLTLKWPILQEHDATGATSGHHVQVIKGGVGLVLPNVQWHSIHDGHFEAGYIAILGWDFGGLTLNNNQNTCNRFLRIANGNLCDIRLGPTASYGNTSLGVSENILTDIPSWNPKTSGFHILYDGPLTNYGEGGPITLTANHFGTSYNVDLYGYHSLPLGTGFAQGTENAFGVKTGSEGLRFRGLLTMAGTISAGTTVCTLPITFTPHRSSLVLVWQSNTQSNSATPVANSLFIQGVDQNNNGLVKLQVATTAAGWLSMDSVPPVSIH